MQLIQLKFKTGAFYFAITKHNKYEVDSSGK